MTDATTLRTNSRTIDAPFPIRAVLSGTKPVTLTPGFFGTTASTG